jgi:hypothetical protein
MRSLTLDAPTLAKLLNLSELLQLSDETGRVLGYFHPTPQTGPEANAKHRSPFTREELERRRQRAGRPLSEILKSLHDE